jgi:hypothetical protein
MQIIDKQVSDILEAYLQLQKAEIDLQTKWRKPLLSIYAQQHKIFEEQLEQNRNQRSEFRRRLRLGVWMASILLLLGFLVLPGLILINELGDFSGPLFCFSPLLILGGLTGWAIIIILWIWQRDRDTPQPPDNPLKSDLFYPLVPAWKDRLIGSLPDKKPSQETTGEYHFIARLLSLTDSSYILFNMQLIRGEKVDIILVGQKGIWVFEVAYIKGLIRWENGEWTITQINRRLARRNQYHVQKIDPGFDVKWQHAADHISKILQPVTISTATNRKEALKIRGGLVFSHPQGRYDIPPGSPFNWGVVPFWLEKLGTYPDADGMNENVIFDTVDKLLKQHHRIAGINQPRSMIVEANQVLENANHRILEWIKRNKLPDELN